MTDQASKLRTMVLKSKANKKIKIISFISGIENGYWLSLIINLAVGLKNKNKNVLVLDLSKKINNFTNISNVSMDKSIDDITKSEINLKDYIITGPYGIDIFIGIENLLEIRKLNKLKKIEIVNKIDYLSNYDFILINNDKKIDKGMLAFINLTNDIILLTKPGLENTIYTYKLIKMFVLNKIKNKIYLIINNAKSKQEADDIYMRLKSTSYDFLGFRINNLGYLNENKKKLFIQEDKKGKLYHKHILNIVERMLSDKIFMSNTYTINDIKTRLKVYIDSL